MNSKNLWVGVLAVLVWTSVSSAAIVINVGDHTLLPDQAGQVVEIHVSGGELVQGLNFLVQLADGGTDNGGVDGPPAITHVDIIGPGTIFNESNFGQNDTVAKGRLWVTSTTTDRSVKSFLNAEGLLARLTFDTTGAAEGSTFPLLLSGVAATAFPPSGVDTDFAGVAAMITNGSIKIAVPEPTVLSLILLTGSGLLATRRRNSCLN